MNVTCKSCSGLGWRHRPCGNIIKTLVCPSCLGKGIIDFNNKTLLAGYLGVVTHNTDDIEVASNCCGAPALNGHLTVTENHFWPLRTGRCSACCNGAIFVTDLEFQIQLELDKQSKS